MARTKQKRPAKEKKEKGGGEKAQLEVKPDYEKNYSSLLDDLIDSKKNKDDQSESDDDYEYGKDKGRGRRGREEEEEKKNPYMLFDFRRGPENWPKGVELVDPSRYAELLEAATAAAEAAAKTKKKDGEGEGDGEKKEAAIGPSTGWSSSFQSNEVNKDDGKDVLHPDAVFETLRDGSKALVIQAGYRLKLNLKDLLEGGDEMKEQRKKKAEKDKKRKQKYKSNYGGFFGDSAGGDSSWDKDFKFPGFKQYINQYTISMDIKLLEEPGREGLSLLQTALVHVKESKRSGKTTLSQSDGECLVNQVGGVGIMGTFGDTTKARLKPGAWKRVVIAVNCSSEQNTKGEMRTWVGVEPGVILKEDVFAANDRFSLDPDGLYLFSSGQSSLMPGRIAIRTVRIEQSVYNDQDVKANRARDMLYSKLEEEKEKSVEEQRKGLSLAPIFAKPRPMWIAPMFSAFFGDLFIQNSTLEGSSNLAWSYEVLNFAMQRLLNNKFLLHEKYNLQHTARVGLSDTLHIMQQSSVVFKYMLKLLKTPTESQLLSFLRKLKKCIQQVNVGDVLLFPVLVEGSEILLMLERSSDRAYRATVIQTNPYGGLKFHANSLKDNKIQYRTCMVLNDIPKKNCLDDVFWMAVYNMAIHVHQGDMIKFYDVLLPFLTGKSLETSLVEAEELTLAGSIGEFGNWRLPQCSDTAYVRTVVEAFHFILRKKGVTELQTHQIHLALGSELVSMMQNDLAYMLPNANGIRICELAMKELSHLSLELSDMIAKSDVKSEELPSESFVLESIYHQVSAAKELIAMFDIEPDDLPPELSLHGVANDKDPNDQALVQFRDMPSWTSYLTDPDPGQAVSLQKYIPVDFLQIGERASTRRQAIEAIRRCDRLCTLLDNQSHCIKNEKFLISGLIEHVFTQVVPIPKPRGVGLTAEALRRSERATRRAEIKKEEEERKKQEKLKLQEEIQSKNGKAKLLKMNKSTKGEESVEQTSPSAESKTDPTLLDDTDFDIGKEFEEEYVSQECIWDMDITYELQVELLLSLQRISEHFVASAMSIQQSRPYDAVCIIVSGAIVAISDAVMRKLAVDEPSEACSHIMGRAVDGRQLGHAGFGVGVGTFASQCETLEIHAPELAIARTAILDYFQSPQQRRLEKIFSWEEHYELKPGKNLVKYFRMIAKEVGFPVTRPHYWLLDGNPITSELFKNYPELKCFRDVVFWWKYFLNPDRKSFQNYVSNEEPRELTRFGRMSAQLSFSWNDNEGGYTVMSLGGVELRCRPDPKQVNPVTRKPIPPEHLPVHRYPSTATPSFYVPPPMIKTEDDVIYRPNLPSFENQEGQVLNQRDSELLISFMTVPYMRIPLILSFFASDDRIHKLQSAELRLILDSVLFEPGKYLRMDMSRVEPTMVPTPHADLLASPHGLLLNELCRSPDSTINSILSLLKGALACDTGSVVDENGEGFNTSTVIILYASRLGARLDNYLSFLITNFGGGQKCTNWPLRGLDILDFSKLENGLKELREILSNQFNALFEDYLHRLHVESVDDPTNETLVDRNSRLACDLHSHKLLLFRNYEIDDFEEKVADTLLGSTIYLTTRHTWNKTTKNGPVLQLPETELYEIVHHTRRKLITWLARCKQGVLDHVMQTALQVSSSITGSFKVSAATMDNQNRWSRIRGDRSIGRWAVGSTRTTLSEAQSSDDLSKGRTPLKRQISIDNDVGEVVDNGMLGVEIDVQVGQLTLRSKHLSALKSDVANHPDVIAIFGDATIQASLINSAENCDYYRLVGLNHEIAYWKTPHNICHPLDDEWERDYDPAELADTEAWIVGLFEPIRKNFFNGPQPPAMQFMMTSKPAAKDAEVIVLLGLHQTLGGPFKLVYLFKKLKCVHIYECVSQGRNWWYSLHLTTDYRYCLRDMLPSDRRRNTQFPEWWVRASGSPYPMGVGDSLMNDIDGVSRLPANSVMIYRDQQHHLNISGGRETLVPSRLLYGAIPEALLEAYVFWEDESVLPPGCDLAAFPEGIRAYQRLRGYPRDKDSEHMIIVEFVYVGSWEHELSATTASQQRSQTAFDVTGFPGRSVRITKRPIALIQENLEAKQRIASHLESLKLLAAPKKTKKVKVETETSVMEENQFKIDAWVECDFEGNSNFWPSIVRRVNDDGTYDLEFVKEYKWLGVQRLINPKTVQARGESEKKKRGEGVWHWEGMSASEDDDWREDSDDEESADDDDEDKTKKARLPFYFFDKLDVLLEVSNRKVEVCIALLDEVSKFHAYFTDIAALCREMRKAADSNPLLVDLYGCGDLVRSEDSEDLLFLNLLYSPHTSRLHSLLKVLCRIENLSYICPWTSKKHIQHHEGNNVFNLIERGCPPLDLIELPRLKLSFTAKFDHEQQYRLYSVDHVDLFISNERIPSYGKMLRGIPHSLIMSNVRGESQILVPVVPVARPFIGDEPFSTFIVLDRSHMPPAERFFLYPIHVSFSFLMTKGVNSALYLMLLKLLHREYSEVFRLADSIATDTSFNDEGLLIYNNFKTANDDRHPDAHACRLKVTLMTIDSDMDLPWDITLEAARHVAKLLRISSDCRIPIREELQILESDQIVLSSESALFKPDDHDEYSMALCFNRKQYLKAVLTNVDLDKVPFILPPRALTSNWSYYQDNTVFGETYQGMREITSVDGEGSWESEKIGVDETDAPPKGWLVVAVFHTLWSTNCIKTMPLLHDLVPMYQNIINFVSIKADAQGMMSVAKSMTVNVFPTVVILRGGKEIQRFEGSEKLVEKLIRSLAVVITEDDKVAKAKYRYRLKMQQALDAGIEFVEPEEDINPVGQIDWTFDPEQCGPSMKIEEDGMRVIGVDQEEEEDDVIWEYRDYGSNSYMWKPFTKDTIKEIEKNYKSGKLYSNGYLYSGEVEMYVNTVKITDYEVSGFTGTLLANYSDIEIRRWAARCPVPNEEDYLSKEQKERDKKTAEWREKMELYKKKLKEEKKGKDIEAIRGTVGFLPNTGTHTWTYVWNHEPSHGGTSDGVGICCELKEDFTATSTPNLGGAQDTGYSLCLYANGSVYHNGKLLLTVDGTRNVVPVETAVSQESANSNEVVDEPVEEQKTEEAEVAQAATSESSEVGANAAPAEEEKVEENFQVATPLIAPVFGRKSKITCEFNTEEDGGVLTVKVDDVPLADVVLKEVFKLLGGAEVFPCLCFAPLEESLVESRKLAQKKKFEKMKAEAEKKGEGEEGENNEDDEQPEQDEDNKKEEEQKKTLETAVLLPGEEELFDSFPSVSLILDTADSPVEAPVPSPEVLDVKPTEVSVEASGEVVATTEAAPVEGSEEAKTGDATNVSVNPAEPGATPAEETPAEETPAEETPAAEAAAEVPLDKVRWMYEDPELGWCEYSLENSALFETSMREGSNKVIAMHNKEKHTCRLDQMLMSSEKDSGKDCRLRRYVLTEGMDSLWEMLCMKFEKPHGLTGQGVLKLFEKVWSGNESMKGTNCSLGFIFLYNLFTGESSCKVIGSSYGGSGGGFGGGFGGGGFGGGFGGYGPSMGPSSFSFGGKAKASVNDSHRFAVLLSQLYTDRSKKSLPGSVINVLSRNRQVALKMPKFKDTRKSSRNAFFNGWVDDQEPASPVADLFRKLVPVMHTLKKKAAFHFPPPPPFPELPSPPSTTVVSEQEVEMSLSMDVPSLTDYGCEERIVPTFSTKNLEVMLGESTFNKSKYLHRNNTVLLVDDERTLNQLLHNNPHKLFVVDFFANWCGPCKALAPVLHSLAVSVPTAIFVKIDVEEHEELSARFSIKSMPTIVFLRGDQFAPEYVLATLQGGGPTFVKQFLATLQKVSTKEEWQLLEKYQSNTSEEQDPKELHHLSLSEKELDTLANEPLAGCRFCFQSKTRDEMQIAAINSELAFNLNQHSAAQTAPARAVLSRFKDDMKAFAQFTNDSPVLCMISLGLDVIRDFFNGATAARQQIERAHISSKELLAKLQELKQMDNQMIQDSIPLLTHAANFINLEAAEASDNESVRNNKVRYLLNRIAGQKSVVWIEFLFGILISTQGEEDLLKLNPFLSKEMVSSIFTLVTLAMMRANRLGHTNRCIGMAINLEKMLENLLAMDPSSLKRKEDVLTPKLTQLVEELGKNITMGRYYMNKVVSEQNQVAGYAFDPRYLVFEFVWNIQLRKKQVSIINDFRESLRNGNSKVKQMIMGAGKTSVVAPLLALIVADGKSLVLSVVPKALVEMSRTRLRETFASIMVKRVYTLEFERSTVVKPSMSKSLENAMKNRGVVVATPTTLKSIMLSYVEVLQHLADAEKSGLKSKLAEKKQQAEELAKILRLFKEGIMLLDEVDLILHPLKSELNFPIGEKFDLDGSEDGERWDLPIHMFDAFLYFTTSKVTAFEQRGIALDILKKISNVIQKGIDERHLQRLPHIILLNPDFYDEYLKPLLAEWAYLWLQKQHLHGIDHTEAIRYMLEGGAAKSDTSTKVYLLEQELAKTQINLGKLSPLVTPTLGYRKAMSPENMLQFETKQRSLKRQYSDSIQSEPVTLALREAEESTLTSYLEVSKTHCKLVEEIHEIDQQIDEISKQSGTKLAEISSSMISLQKQIQEIECPKDDSLDNSIVVWCSHAFASGESNTGASAGESSVPMVCSALEDTGFTIRRCSDPEELYSCVKDLHQEGQLRCIIIGGEERGACCGPSCVKSHQGNCVVCGKPFHHHSSHECPSGGRGSWHVESTVKAAKWTHADMVGRLTANETKNDLALPAVRVAIYSAHLTLTETERMSIWKTNAHVVDDSKTAIQWVQALPSWNQAAEDEEGVDEEKESDAQATVKSDELVKAELKALKADLEALEHRKTNLDDEDDVDRRKLQQAAASKHQELFDSVEAVITMLQAADVKLETMSQLLPTPVTLKPEDIVGQSSSGKNACLALAWLQVHYEHILANPSSMDEKLFLTHWKSIQSELNFLKKMELAAKVVARVSSPHHKKLLNLCHNWLRTFLPHCLAKVNRVSFGLLSSEDCRQALEQDPFVPRSRLKLAVPFIGKDVPSKASEFAHPDIIIGLTVLAYRYSGLRAEDYTDLVDRLTAQYSVEIGPSRERPSSLRHEKWVFASGGAIRGLATTKDGLPWNVGEAAADDKSTKEVVQLKFLQKSNKEQMDKLYQLIRREPLVIHHYLQSMIFPNYMRSQKLKLSASGQAVGGDMLVGKRVGFSGTPSDLLPEELGRCDYETGDDGMMIATCLDRSVATYEYISNQWTVDHLLERIATADNPRYNALIDTGALITGYSNQEVAQKLLDMGLTWCDGVVFLDDQDKQQVLVRATGRVVSADQCGVSLDKRFAFYDQIHTTGMDIKHVVNATAVITLGKDMVFRDYVQGAYRMRGIGMGQKIHIFIIPEVRELISRELQQAEFTVSAQLQDHTLEDVVAWLIVNSLRSEQTQWTMLCVQNISNLYRKNAFRCLHDSTAFFTNGLSSEIATESGKGSAGALSIAVEEHKAGEQLSRAEFIAKLDKLKTLEIFNESIDFSLDAGVPDPIPFEKKLRAMLEENEDFLLPDQHVVGNRIMELVGQFSMLENSANRLDTEQEREQEQEQEKEVEQRRDQQIEIEKFVEREYSRQEESQVPWAFKTLAQDVSKSLAASASVPYPFYPLSAFKLKHHDALTFPNSLFVSNNFFNLNWNGLRRVKNVVMILEFAPSMTNLKLKQREEYDWNISDKQRESLQKAFALLGYHAASSGHEGFLNKEDLAHAIFALTDEEIGNDLMDMIDRHFMSNGLMSWDQFQQLVFSGVLYPESKGRHWVAVSLAEAETIRRVLHIRNKTKADLISGATTELALHYSPMCAPNHPPAGDGGVVLDCTVGWEKAESRAATRFESGVAHSCFRFFDCDMHYTNASLNTLIKVLRGSTRDKEQFFLSLIGVKRRLERKWRETPLAKVFTIPDFWSALKNQSMAIFVSQAAAKRNLTLWEAFMTFDYDNNGLLTPAEFYGALRWLNIPAMISTEDVVDCIEAMDKGRDGLIDYREYMDYLSDSISKSSMDLLENQQATDRGEVHFKVEPYGADELRDLILVRKQKEQQRIREERLRKQAYKDALDIQIFEEELEASKLRKGGQNPRMCDVEINAHSALMTDFNFCHNQGPLRFAPTGKNSFVPIYLGTAASPPIKPLDCPGKHGFSSYHYYWMNCALCKQRETHWVCWNCSHFICSNCYEGHKIAKERERRDSSKHPTFLRCLPSSSFTIQVPRQGGASKTSGNYTINMELRFQKLPPKNQLQSLLRFSLPDASHAKRAHRTSVYLNGDGYIVAKPIEEGGGVGPEASKIRVNVWAIVSVVVQLAEGKVSTFINGVKCHEASNMDPQDLKLQHRMVVLGGGKQAHIRGGDVRRVTILDRDLAEDSMQALFVELAKDSPSFGHRVARIQTVYRGFICRRRITKEKEAEAAAEEAAALAEQEKENPAESIETAEASATPEGEAAAATTIEAAADTAAVSSETVESTEPTDAAPLQ